MGNEDRGGVDQIAQAVEQIRFDPNLRRIVVSAWNVGEIDEMVLPPCHVLFQFSVDAERLSCHVYQRSADLSLGVPFTPRRLRASHPLGRRSLRTRCRRPHLDRGRLPHLNHLEQVDEQFTRRSFPPPILSLRRHLLDRDQYGLDDLELTGYRAHPRLRAPVAV